MKYLWRTLGLSIIFVVVFAMAYVVLGQIIPNILATNTATLIRDGNNDGLADGGDNIRYTVVIANCSTDPLSQVSYQSQIDPNTRLLPGSAQIQGVQDAVLCGDLAPSSEPQPSDAPAPVAVDASATDDAFSVTNGGNNTEDVLANDAGDAPLTVVSFGDSLANVGTTPADGATTLPIASGGGTVDITLDATGNIDITASGTTGTGTVTIFYEMQAGNGTTDTAQVDITYGDFPTAQDDTLANGVTFTTPINTTFDSGSASYQILLNNDTLGTPAGTLVSFGGGDLSGDASTNTAPGAQTVAGFGTITLTDTAGNFEFVPELGFTGVFTFDYRLDNGIGFSDATVEIYVEEAPTAVADTYTVAIGSVDNSNNVTDNDTLGAPPAVVDFYANAGDIGGASQVASPGVYTHPTGGFTVTINSAGNITIDASLGGVVAANGYTFDYQITNSGGSSVATVTVDIVQTPTTADDDFTILLGNNLSGDVTADNGNGIDNPGTPPFTSLTFGAGDLGGTVTSNAGGSSVTLAGGTLTVNNDGTFTLNGATTTGSYTFQYELTNTNGTSASATVTIEIQEAPTAQDDNPAPPIYQVTLGNTLTINVGANDLLQNADPNGADSLGFPLATITTFGATCAATLAGNAGNTDTSAGLTVNDDGSFTYTPTVLGTGTHTFCYTLSNGVVPDSTANVTILVVEGPTAVNDTDATLALGARYNTTINTNFSSDGATFPHLTGNDNLGAPAATVTQVDGNAVTVGNPIAVTNGNVTINDASTGAFTFAPSTGFTGTASFTYTLTNANGNSTATAEVNVNQAPTAQDDNTPVGGQASYAVSGAGPFTFGAGSLFADNGAGADTLGTPNSVVTSFGPSTGTETAAGGTGDTSLEAGILTVNADGSFSINPTVLGDHVFVYEIENTDSNGAVIGTDTATVTIRYQSAPVANNDTFTFANTSDQTAPATLFVDNGSSADSLGSPTANIVSFGGGDSTGVLGTTTAGSTVTIAGGNLTVNANGTWTLTGQPFTPGQYTFDYRLDNGVATNDATVTINIQAPPTAVDDGSAGTPAYAVALTNTSASTAATGVMQNNDDYTLPNVFPDATVTRYANVSDIGGGSNVLVGGTYTIPGSGGVTATISADGTISLDATAGGAIAGDYEFDYEIANVAGSSVATVFIRVTQGPIANDDTFTVQFDDASPVINGDLTANNGVAVDTDGSPPFTTLTFGGGDLGGAVTDNTATAGGTSVSLAGGTNNLTIFDNGTITLTSAGTLTPGQYTFDYRLDNGVATNDATVTINIQAPPTAVADSINVNLGASTGLVAAASGLRNNDDWTLPNVYPNATITAASDTDNTVALTIGTPYAIPVTGGTLTINADGSYTLDATGATGGGTFNFEYTLTNAAGSDTASLTVTIETPPQVTSTTPLSGATVPNNQTLTIDFSEPVDLATGAFTVTCAATPVTVNVTGGLPQTGITSVDVVPATTWTNGTTCELTAIATSITDSDTLDTPNPGANQLDGNNDNTGGDNYTFTFTIDEQPRVSSVQVEKSDTLGDIATSPNDTDVDLDTTIVVNFSENVFGIGEWITLDCDSSGIYNQMGTGTSGVAIVVTPSLSGTTSTATISRASGTFTPAETCTITIGASSINDSDAIDPPANMASDYSDTFTLINQFAPTANDDGGFTVTVNGALNAGAGILFNDNGSGADNRGLPQADIVSFGGGSITGSTLVTDFTAGSTTGAGTFAGGTLTVNANGSFTVTNPTTAGTYTFVYRLTNVIGSSDATVTIEVQEAPTANDDTVAGTSVVGDDFHTALNTQLVGADGSSEDLLTNDVLGVPTATISAFDNPSTNGGAVTVNADGSFTYDPPNATFTGTDTFTYTLNNILGSDSATVTVAVGNRPVCTVDAYAGMANIGFSVNAASGVLNNDTGDSITVTGVDGTANIGVAETLASGATVTLNADGSFDYEPPAGVSGVNADSFTYAISNGFGEVTTNCTTNITLNTDAGAVAWFIDQSATGSSNVGTFSNPFTSIASFNAVNNNTGNNPGDGDVVYIDPDGTYNETGGVNTRDSQEFYGGTVQFNTVYNTSSVTAPVTLDTAYTTFASIAANTRPRTQISVTNSGVNAFFIASNNTVQGFAIGNTVGTSYAFSDGNVAGGIGTTTISDTIVTGTGGVIQVLQGGTLNATFDEITVTGSLNAIFLTNVNGTLNATSGNIIHGNINNMIRISGGNIGGTIATSFVKSGGTTRAIQIEGGHTGTLNFTGTLTSTGGFTGSEVMRFDNADGTYNFSGVVDINGADGGVNIVNGSDGTLTMTNPASFIRGINGIPFRINNSTMDVNYDGNITHEQVSGADITARTVEIIGGTGTIAFNGTIDAGSSLTRVTNDTLYLEDTGNANTISFNYVDVFSINTAVIRSLTSGDISVNRLRFDCDGDLTLGGDTHCVQISDTTSSGVTIEAATARLGDGGDNGGAISLVNTPGIWTVEDIAGGIRGLSEPVVVGNNFGTLQIATVNSPTSPFGIATGPVSSDGAAAFDLTNGNVNIDVTTLDASNVPVHGINLVNVSGPLFRASGNVAMNTVAGGDVLINIGADNTANALGGTQTVTVDAIDIGTNGTTNNNVLIRERHATPIRIGNYGDVAGDTIRFGNVDIGNAALGSPTGNGIEYLNSTGSVTFNQTDINMTGTVSGTEARTPITVGLPNVNDISSGNGILIEGGTGAFTTNGGTIRNTVGEFGDGIDARRAGALNVNNVTIQNTGGNNVQLTNMNGNSTFDNITFRDYESATPSVSNSIHAILMRSNTNAEGDLILVDPDVLQTSLSAVRQIMVFVQTLAGASGNVDVSITENVANQCLFTGLAVAAFGTEGTQAFGVALEGNVTSNTVVRDCIFDRTSIAVGLRAAGTSNLNGLVDNNLITNADGIILPGIGAINLQAQNSGDLDAIVRNNDITTLVEPSFGAGIVLQAINTSDADVHIDNNTITNQGDGGEGIYVQFLDDVPDGDLLITNNTIDAVGSDGIFVQASAGSIPGGGNHDVEITGNSIGQSGNPTGDGGIFSRTRNDHEMNYTILNNTIYASGTGVEIENRDTGVICVDISNNTLAQAPVIGIDLEIFSSPNPYRVEGPGTAGVTPANIVAVQAGGAANTAIVDPGITFNNNANCEQPPPAGNPAYD